jgi:hypothetical protein
MSRWSWWRRRTSSPRRRKSSFPSTIRLELPQLDTRFLPGETIGAGSLAWLTAAAALYQFWHPGKSILAQETRRSNADLATPTHELSITGHLQAEVTTAKPAGETTQRRDEASGSKTNDGSITTDAGPSLLSDQWRPDQLNGVFGGELPDSNNRAELGASGSSSSQAPVRPAWSTSSTAGESDAGLAVLSDVVAAGGSGSQLDTNTAGNNFLPPSGVLPPASPSTSSAAAAGSTNATTGQTNSHQPFIKTVSPPATRPPSGVEVIKPPATLAPPTTSPPPGNQPVSVSSNGILITTWIGAAVTPLISDPGLV